MQVHEGDRVSKYALKELQNMSRKEDAHCRWGELYESRFRGVKNNDAKIDKIPWGFTKWLALFSHLILTKALED